MDLKFKRGQRLQLDKIDVNPGVIYLTEDTQNLFVDDLDKRLQLSDTKALRFEIIEEVEFGEEIE